ncbi:hypothetical protein Pelo_17245 [Pelomyxa schiedti]|nr:hypothetical protein Pelo_17245 [Pelomyxa schiedti]
MSVYLHFLCGWHPRAGAQSLMTRTKVSADIGVGIVRSLTDNIEKRCVNCGGYYTQATNANDACRYHPVSFTPLAMFFFSELTCTERGRYVPTIVVSLHSREIRLYPGTMMCVLSTLPCFSCLRLMVGSNWVSNSRECVLLSILPSTTPHNQAPIIAQPNRTGDTFLFGRKLNQPDDTILAHTPP